MRMDSILASEQTLVAAGVWHPPHSSRQVPARLVDIGGTITALSDEDGESDRRLAWGIRSDIEISPRVGSVPRRITFRNESVFVTRDNDAVDSYLKGLGEARSG